MNEPYQGRSSKALKEFLQKHNMKEEVAEIANEYYENTGYPVPKKSYRLMIESFSTPVEETYFWMLNHLKQDQGFPYIYKTIDNFSASETSSFWGQNTQRLNMQQDKAGNYLRVISELIKQLFQIVRELRMIDEKLDVRKAWKDDESGEKLKSADVTLKGEFVELVEGGAKNVNSVYGLAREVGYSILPDLFFNTQVYSLKEIDKVVDDMEYNERVKNVLRKKLYNFVNWKLNTDKEFYARRKFQLKYLYQHWQTIRAYMKWLTPYLRNIKRLNMKKRHAESVDIVSAFESTVIEVEYLAVKPILKDGKRTGANACNLINFYYTTRPEMNFHTQDYSNKGAIHVGRVEVLMKAYGWSDKELANYRKYREEEDFELLGLADSKIESAIEMLGDTFKSYLAECGEELFKDDKKEENKKNKPKQESILDPFLGIFKAFGEVLGMEKKSKTNTTTSKYLSPSSSHKKAAEGAAAGSLWQVYKNYKKAHKMLSW
jgi:hypothetical protein